MVCAVCSVCTVWERKNPASWMALSWPWAVRLREIVSGSFFCCSWVLESFCWIVVHEKNRVRIIKRVTGRFVFWKNLFMF